MVFVKEARRFYASVETPGSGGFYAPGFADGTIRDLAVNGCGE